MSYLMARLWVDKGLLEIAKDNYQRLGLLLDVRGYQGHLIQLWWNGLWAPKGGLQQGDGGATCEDSSKDVRVMFNNNNNNTKEKVMDSWCMS